MDKIISGPLQTGFTIGWGGGGEKEREGRGSRRERALVSETQQASVQAKGSNNVKSSGGFQLLQLPPLNRFSVFFFFLTVCFECALMRACLRAVLHVGFFLFFFKYSL